MKTRPVGAVLFHTDGRTVMTKLIVAFRNFAKSYYKVTNKDDGETIMGRVVKLLPMHIETHPSRPDILQHIRCITAWT